MKRKLETEERERKRAKLTEEAVEPNLIEFVPEDVWDRIFSSFNDQHSLMTVACVCKTWKKVSLHNLFSYLLASQRYTGSDTLLLKFNSVKRVEKLDLRLNRALTDNSIRHLDGLTQLSLLGNNNITVAAVSNLTNLLSLDLTNNNPITELSPAMTNLTSLNIVNSELAPSSLLWLSNLTELRLEDNIFVANEHVTHLINLRTLNLASNKLINNEGIRHLTRLESLDLCANSEITDAGLTSLPHLRSLILSYNLKITDNGIRGIGSAHPFKEPDTKLGDEVANIPNLRYLDLCANTNITDSLLSSLTSLTSLELSLNSTISDEGIRNLTKLRYLGLQESNITDDSLTNLCDLESANFTGSKITDFGLRFLTKLKALRLNFSTKGGFITSAGVSQLTSLEVLFAEQNKEVVEALPCLTNITLLSVPITPIRASSLELLTNLTALDLWHCKSVDYLPTLKNLKILGVGLTSLADDSISKLTSLTALDIYNTHSITAASVLALPYLAHLSHDCSAFTRADVGRQGIVLYTPYDWWQKFFGADITTFGGL